jgi:predicted dehydrogenase
MLIHGRHAGGCVSNVEIVGGEDTPLLFELRGSKGNLTIRGHHPGGYQCGDLEVTASGKAEPQPRTDLSGLNGAAINVAEVWQRFEEDIRSGSRTVPDFELAVRLTRLLDAIETASDEGRNVTANGNDLPN